MSTYNLQIPCPAAFPVASFPGVCHRPGFDRLQFAKTNAWEGGYRTVHVASYPGFGEEPGYEATFYAHFQFLPQHLAGVIAMDNTITKKNMHFTNSTLKYKFHLTQTSAVQDVTINFLEGDHKLHSVEYC